MRLFWLRSMGIGLAVATAAGCGSDDGTGRATSANISVSERTWIVFRAPGREEPAVAARETAQTATIAFLDAFFDDRREALPKTLDGLAAQGNAVERDL